MPGAGSLKALEYVNKVAPKDGLTIGTFGRTLPLAPLIEGAKFDASKDGKLSLKEFEALWLDFTRQQMVRAFQRLDGYGDAAVTVDEYVKPTSRMVMRGDRNDDGKLDQNDFRRQRRGNAPQTAPKGESK